MSRKELILAVYLPTFILSFGQGMLLPTIPIYAKSFDVSFGLVGLAVGAMGLGTLLWDVPSGLLLGRVGRKGLMLIGTGSLVLSGLALGLARFFPELIVYRLIAGFGSAMWNLSRHAYIVEVAPVLARGRTIAVFGGINRIGTFAGPALGGYVSSIWGLRAPFFFYAGLAAVTVVLSIIFITESGRSTSDEGQKMSYRDLAGLLKQNFHELAAAGSAQIFAQMIRAGRQTIIPLYGAYVIGLDVKSIGWILSLSAAIDMSIFYPAGLIMDRLGRKYASVPSFTILSLGMALIPFSHSFLGLALAASIMGLGNGLGSGTMMTLGADLAPPGRTGEFLGIWRLIGDTGATGGPVLVGKVADIFGLSFAAFVLAGIGLLGAGTLFLFVPETLKERPGQSPTS